MPKLELDDTIAAIATPAGEGGISVIRVSGPDVLDAVQPFFDFHGEQKLKNFPANTIHWGRFMDFQKQVVDQVLVSIFHAPHSYTGQNAVEISCHGGLAVTKRILNLLLEKGIRHADPGEFTRRAFLNGKLDLVQAEAVLDLIHAKSTRGLGIAVRQLSGSLSQTLKNLKGNLLQLLAHVEAYIDFPEEDLGVDVSDGMQKQITAVRGQVLSLISGFQRNLLVREGILVTIVGKPNVGKSSLFNALLERDRALVSEWPHTTRDHLEESLEIQGFYVRLQDTAGLVPAPGHPLERLGMERTMKTLQESHLVLFVVDGSQPLEEPDRHVYCQIPKNKAIITLINKADLPMKIRSEELSVLAGTERRIRISAKTREGFQELEQRIFGFLEQETSEAGEQITRLRHKVILEKAAEALQRTEISFKKRVPFELLALDIRAVLEALQELTGEVYSEELLDMIFSEFCIGK